MSDPRMSLVIVEKIQRVIKDLEDIQKDLYDVADNDPLKLALLFKEMDMPKDISTEYID